MSASSSSILSKRLTHYLLIFGFVLIIIGFAFRQTVEVYEGFMIFAIVISGIALLGPIHERRNDSNEKNKFFIMIVASSLYAVIAGLALKTVFDSTFTKKIMMEVSVVLNQTSEHAANASLHTLLVAIQNSQYHVLMMFSFIVTAVPFYHGAMIFLSEHVKLDNKSNSPLFYNFGFLFLQSIVLLGLAFSLESFLLSIGMLVLLMVISSLWVIIITKKMKTGGSPPLGWLCLNLGFSAALFLITYDGWTAETSSWYLAAVCSVRTFVDYVLFRSMYVMHVPNH